MDQDFQEQLRRKAEIDIPWGFRKWTEALRSTVLLNGAGIAATLALMQVMPKYVFWLCLTASPFVLGILLAMVSWIFTFVGPSEDLERTSDIGLQIANIALWCAGFFACGLLFTSGNAIYLSWLAAQ